MKIRINTRLLSLVFLAMLIGMAISCKKDDGLKSGKVELLSFGPAGVKHGEEIRFIGKNLDKVTEIELAGASVPGTAFIQQSSELIVIVVPQEAEKGFVTLKTPEGDVVSKTQIDFDVPFSIASVPDAARPGENITITGNYMNWITGVQFSDDILVTEFVSQSLSELVVTVPMAAKTGPLVFLGGGTEPVTIETEKELRVSLPSISGMSPNPVNRGDNLIITGTDLDLAEAVIFKGEDGMITEFVSQSPTRLVVKVPEKANKGKISLVAFSGLSVQSEESLSFVGDLPDLDPLKYAIYVDALENNWQDWGWGKAADFSNTENVRDGDASIKVSYEGGWGALKFANASVSTSSYSEITFSIFGTPGTGEKVLNVSINEGDAYSITIEEGKWVEYKLTKADFGNPETIDNLMFQDTGWAGTIYIDHVGLR